MSDLNDILGEPAEPPQEAPAPEAAPAEQASDAAAPAAQVTANTADAAAAQPEQPKMVPYQALQEERRMRQQLARERAEMEQRVEQRLAALQQQLAPPPPAPPDPTTDPVGFLAHQQQTVSQQVEQLARQQQAAQQQAQIAAAEQQLARKILQAEAEFRTQAPDYDNALSHLHALRVRELQVLGHDEAAAQEQSLRELKQAAFVHAAHGRSPAEVMYGLAKVRGYASKPQAPTVTPAEQMQMAQRGTQAATSLGGGGGTAGKLDAKALLAMSDEEFAAATSGKKWAQIMGG